jgi:hypothetical protein
MRTSKYLNNKKPISECTDKELKEVMSIARMHAKRKGKDELADDFASFLMEDLARQGVLYYNLQWRWAQFLREQKGNLAQKKGQARALGEFKPVQIDHVVEGETPLQPVDLSPLPDEPDDINLFSTRVRGAQERGFLILKSKWGFTNAEIGEVFGVSVQRIEQIHRTIERRLKARGFA